MKHSSVRVARPDGTTENDQITQEFVVDTCAWTSPIVCSYVLPTADAAARVISHIRKPGPYYPISDLILNERWCTL